VLGLLLRREQRRRAPAVSSRTLFEPYTLMETRWSFEENDMPSPSSGGLPAVNDTGTATENSKRALR